MRIGTRSGQARFALEIYGIDNESIPLPMANRVSPPLANAPVWTPIQRDDASAVDHFIENHDGSGSLEQLNIIVVGARNHRRPGVEAHETTLLERAIFPRIGGRMSELVIALRSRTKVRFLLPLWRPSGKAAVGRIHDQGGALGPRDFVAPVIPKFVVRNDAARRVLQTARFRID